MASEEKQAPAALDGVDLDPKAALSILVVGASGDLAKKKTFPALFELFRDHHIPDDVILVGYARREKTSEAFRSHLRPYVTTRPTARALCVCFPLTRVCHRYLEKKAEGSSDRLDKFLMRIEYRQGQYNSVERFAEVAAELEAMEDAVTGGTGKANRLFYYAIPPTVFSMVSRPIKESAMTSRGWNRVVVEKPFGRDLDSSRVLSEQLAAHFTEEQVRTALECNLSLSVPWPACCCSRFSYPPRCADLSH